MYDDQSSILQFGGSILPINLDYSSATVCQNCCKYDTKLATSKSWHELAIDHKGQLQHMTNGKQLILDAIYYVVDNEEFYPVAYRQGAKIDKMLVRHCRPAIDKLFDNALKIQIAKGPTLKVTVLFNIAQYEFGQITPQNLMSRVVFNQLNSLVRNSFASFSLNLSRFGDHREFQHMIINLGNTAVFSQLCHYILRCDDRFNNVNGINLRGNRIRSVEPLQLLASAHFDVIDLSNNLLSSVTRFCRDIKPFTATHLLLAGNPLVNSLKYPDCLKEANLEKNFNFVDNVPFAKLSKSYTPMAYEIDVDCDGYRIDGSNKHDIMRFANSGDWHAIVIFNAVNELSKDELFDYFFLLLDTDLSEFYPCYYKMENGEHSFIVRKCFDQLQHLAENSNFTLKVPRLVRNDVGVDELIYDRELPFYMRMSASTYKQHQLRPLQKIEEAIEKRFNMLDRLLNLEGFQCSDDLEHVVVNMSSSKILMTILSIAGRKYLDNCTDLRLGENKIMRFESANMLCFLSNLKAIDLSNNWLYDLDSIRELSVLRLKVLRLDGNPLCNNYIMPSEYIAAVCNIFPQLIQLDNADLLNNPTLATRKNFLIKLSGYYFVEEFVRGFFSSFEQCSNRASMLTLYAPEAVFSMTFNYKLVKITTELYQHMSKYKLQAHNLLNHGILEHRYHVGADAITHVFRQLPSVKYDFQSMQIDVPHCDIDGGLCAIYVKGIFSEEGSALDGAIVFNFMRCIYLRLCNDDEGVFLDGKRYHITNDSLSLTNPTAAQISQAFKYNTTQESKTAKKLTAKEKESYVLVLEATTGLNTVWCNRILEDVDWDYVQALTLFLQLQGNGTVPTNAWGCSS